MSKLSFRARALDANKPVAVYRGDEIPEQLEFGAANRSIVEMPTGMEKEEESEHHLQRALNAQQIYGSSEVLVIPIPDMDSVGGRYNKLYTSNVGPGGFKLPKQYIHVQPPGVDQEIPEYDMDSEDELWLSSQVKTLKMDVPPIKFENMLDRLEKGSGQMVVTLGEAKALLKEDDDLIMAVYDYWLNKRLKLQHPLIPQVRGEKRDGSVTTNPYVAFRRRTERMQTRKNRKNDEHSYEKMLKLKKDLNNVLLMLETLKRREKNKKELLNLTFEVYEQRYKCQDWDGTLLQEAKLHSRRAMTTSYLSTVHQPIGSTGVLQGAPQVLGYHHGSTALPAATATAGGVASRAEWDRIVQEDNRARRKREYKKRKHKPGGSTTAANATTTLGLRHIISPQQLLYKAGLTATTTAAGLLQRQQQQQQLMTSQQLGEVYNSGGSMDEDSAFSASSGESEGENESDPDGVYAFRRRPHCEYLPVREESGVTVWPWSETSLGHSGAEHVEMMGHVETSGHGGTSGRGGALGHEGSGCRDRYRYRLASLRQGEGERCVGYVRRRVGRGGRVLLDRAATQWDEPLTLLDPSLVRRHPAVSSPIKPDPSASSGLSEPIKIEPTDVKLDTTSIEIVDRSRGTDSTNKVDNNLIKILPLGETNVTNSLVTAAVLTNSFGLTSDVSTLVGEKEKREGRGVTEVGSHGEGVGGIEEYAGYITSHKIPFYHQVSVTVPAPSTCDTGPALSSVSTNQTLDRLTGSSDIERKRSSTQMIDSCQSNPAQGQLFDCGRSEEGLEGPTLKRLKLDPEITVAEGTSVCKDISDSGASTDPCLTPSKSGLGLSTMPDDNILLLNFPIPPPATCSSSITPRSITTTVRTIATTTPTTVNRSGGALPAKTGSQRQSKPAASKGSARGGSDSVIGALVGGRGVMGRYQITNQISAASLGTFPPNVVATFASTVQPLQGAGVRQPAARLPTVITTQRLPGLPVQQQQLLQRQQGLIVQRNLTAGAGGDASNLRQTVPALKPTTQLHTSASTPVLSQVVLGGAASSGLALNRSVVTFTRATATLANSLVQASRGNPRGPVPISSPQSQGAPLIKIGSHPSSVTNSLTRDTREDLVATTTKDSKVVAMEVT